jgi:hypothetical protein
MSQDHNRQDGLPSSPALRQSAARPGRLLAVLAVVAACALLAGGAYWFTRRSLSDSHAETPPASQGAASSINPAQMFVGWNKPDFVLALTGQTHGYLQRCGCSSPQYGGLDRRWEFLDQLTKKGWTVIPIDTGEVTPTNNGTPAKQNLLKYETAMRAMGVLGYHVVGLGRDEFRTGLITELLPQFALNNPRPRHVALNLDGEPPGILREMGVKPYEVVSAGASPKIGVVGVIGAKVGEEFKGDPKLTFPWAIQMLPGALKELKAKAEFNVMIFQGLEDEAQKCAAWMAEERRKNPGLAAVHVMLHNNRDAEPPGVPTDVAGTQLITVGHKGKYVGILGVWRQRGSFEYKYQMVAMGPEFEAKPGNPIMPLLEDYARKNQERKFMAQFLRGPHKTQRLLEGKVEVKYVGSERCADCHGHADMVWHQAHDGKSHSHAYQTLVDAKNPGLRQFDGECVQCHTVGFRHDWGYNDPRYTLPNTAPNVARIKDKLRDVGCESCHGPASMHVNNPNNTDYYPLINEFAARHNPKLQEAVRLRRIDDFCQKCHDIENDVHWNFAQKWAKVIHMTPKANGK